MITFPEDITPSERDKKTEPLKTEIQKAQANEADEICSDGSASAFSGTESILDSELDHQHQKYKNKDPDNASGKSDY